MANCKSWTIYVIPWTIESDDVLSANFVYIIQRRRHGYESQTSLSGGGVRGRKAAWRLGMFEDTKIATWRSGWSASSAIRRWTNTRALTEDDRLSSQIGSCEPCLRDQVRRWATVASEKDVVDCYAYRHRAGKRSECVVVLTSGAVDWYLLFVLNLQVGLWHGIFMAGLR